jgi:hypothetical protein
MTCWSSTRVKSSWNWPIAQNPSGVSTARTHQIGRGLGDNLTDWWSGWDDGRFVCSLGKEAAHGRTQAPFADGAVSLAEILASWKLEMASEISSLRIGSKGRTWAGDHPANGHCRRIPVPRGLTAAPFAGHRGLGRGNPGPSAPASSSSATTTSARTVLYHAGRTSGAVRV